MKKYGEPDVIYYQLNLSTKLKGERMFNPKGTTDEEIRQERIKYLEERIKERKISKAYIEQTMNMFGLDYQSAMMAALAGW